MRGPDKSPSSKRSAFTLIGLSADVVFRMICGMLMPSSARKVGPQAETRTWEACFYPIPTDTRKRFRHNYYAALQLTDGTCVMMQQERNPYWLW